MFSDKIDTRKSSFITAFSSPSFSFQRCRFKLKLISNVTSQLSITRNLKINAMTMSSCGPSSFYLSSSSSVPTSISPLLTSPSSTSSSSVTGYPRQILGLAPVEIDPNYLCGHCKELLRDPVQASCGHRFCQICLHKLIEGLRYTSYCPCDDELIDILGFL